MRGLTIRMKYAKGVVAASIFGNDDDRANELWESTADAWALGYFDHENGREDPPGMIKDVSGLLLAWQSGWNAADESEAIRHCPTCQSNTSVYCPVHG